MLLKSTAATFAACAAACLLALLLSVPSFWAFSRIQEASHARKHTFEVILHGEALLTALIDAETGERGYALTGDEPFLEPYIAVSGEVSEQLKALQGLVQAKEAQGQLAALVPLVDAKLAEIARVIQLRRSGGLGAARAAVAEGTGKHQMDAIRDRLRAFAAAEQAVLSRNDAAIQGYMRNLLTVIVSVSVAILLAALFGVYLLQRRSQQLLRDLVHAETRHLLEAQERTNEDLTRANTGLESAMLIAQQANLAKSDFLSSMSHELRTPLNAILGFAQLLESSAPPPTEAQRVSVGRILEAGWYLLKLINEILDLAVIESGRLSISKEPVALGEVLQECRTLVAHQGQARGIQLTFPAFPAPLYVHADRLRLKQILLNLLSNAIKYNQNGGQVEVACASPFPGRLRLSVRDTGPGLSGPQLAQLFQPFNRLGQEHGPEQGTGIGLAMSKLLVELMGGVIGVDSTLGEGSVFWLELNASAAPALVGTADAAALALPAGPVRAPGECKVLCIEDNPANLALIEQLLRRRPEVRMLSAGEAGLGLQLARTLLPRVILMDINLPGISGLQALRILREDSATAHIPVLAISANAMPNDISRGLEAGFFRYLTKPIQIRLFMEALDEALEVTAAPGEALPPVPGSV